MSATPAYMGLPTERQVQRSILDMIRLCFPAAIYHHAAVTLLSGNERQRGMQMGAMKGDGFKPGFPDLIVLWPHGKGALIEVKRPKVGKVSPVQAELHEQLAAIGWPVAVVTSPEDAFDFLKAEGAPWSGVELRAAA
jgi:hypothetical protein